MKKIKRIEVIYTTIVSLCIAAGGVLVAQHLNAYIGCTIAFFGGVIFGLDVICALNADSSERRHR